jgi:cell division protein FtsN
MIRGGMYLLKFIWCACKETKKNMDQLIARNTGYSRPETSGTSDWDEQMRMHQQQMLIQQQIDEQCQRDMQWQFDENQRLFTEQQHRDMEQFQNFSDPFF